MKQRDHRFLERRKEPRRAVSRVVRIQVGANQPDYEGLVTDLSSRGLRLYVQNFELPETFNVIFEDTHERRECKIVWRIGPEVGVQFVPTLRFPPSSRTQTARLVSGRRARKSGRSRRASAAV